jgi:hypothetical protein
MVYLMFMNEDIEMAKNKNDLVELYAGVVDAVKVEEPVKVVDVVEEPVKVVELTLEDLKAEIGNLSGKDKLVLFNWLKGSGSNKVVSAKNVGVGDFVREKIFEGLSNNEIVESCKQKYGNEQTSYNCVVWYRNKMKKEGLV